MTSIRSTFLPDTNCIFIRVDLSQAEDRLCKMWTGQKRMRELANLTPDIYDAHTENAKTIFGLDEVTKAQRYLGKTVVHGSQRKLQGKTMSEGLLKGELIISPQRCQGLIDKYLRMNPEFEKYYFPMVEQTLMRKRKLVNSWGREWWIPEWEPITDELLRQGYSFFMQADCADLLNQWGYIPTSRFLEGKGSNINAQVHDEVIVSCPVGEAWEVANFIVNSLERPLMVNGAELVIPAEVTVGSSWAGGTELYPLPGEGEFMDVVMKYYKEVRG